MNKQIITQGEANVIRTCAWKWFLRYGRQLNPPEEFIAPLEVGTMAHGGIGACYLEIQRQQLAAPSLPCDIDRSLVEVACFAELSHQAQRVRETEAFGLFGEDEAEVAHEQVLREAQAAMKLFMDNVLFRDIERFVVIAVELPFKVPLRTVSGRRSGDELEGVIDLVLYDIQTGKIVLGEHKTTKGDAFTYDFRIEVDPQIPLYLYALRNVFDPEEVGGAIRLNVVRKVAPHEPNVNKDGSVSTAACDTTREVYERALQRQCLEPEFLEKAREALLAKETTATKERYQRNLEKWAEIQQKQKALAESLGTIDRWASCHEAVLTDDLIERYAVDAWSMAQLIRQFESGRIRPWRNGYSCNTRALGKCAYRDACVQDVIEPGELLRKRPNRHNEVVEAQAEAERVDLWNLATESLMKGRAAHAAYTPPEPEQYPWEL